MVEQKLIDPALIPAHVAIIMDGNGRWAQQKKRPRLYGHKVGVDSVQEVVECAAELGVKVLTLYAFSSENWKRPGAEVTGLMGLLKNDLITYDEAIKNTSNPNNFALKVKGVSSTSDGQWKDFEGKEEENSDVKDVSGLDIERF